MTTLLSGVVVNVEVIVGRSSIKTVTVPSVLHLREYYDECSDRCETEYRLDVDAVVLPVNLPFGG